MGTYTLEEIVTPDGYNLLKEKPTITVTWTDPDKLEDGAAGKTTGGYTITSTEGVDVLTDGSVYQLNIANFTGVELRSTGGIGTTIFYVAGSLMVLAAAILLITKRRMGAED